MEALAILLFLAVGYIVGSIRVINEGYEAIVERLGRYRCKLSPGLNFIVPLLDQIVWVATTREQILDITPQDAFTSDNVNLQIDAVIYWRILEVQQTYYTIEDVEEALRNLVITTLRSQVGEMKLEETYSNRQQTNRILLEELDDATATWGVKVIRVEVQNINLPETIQKSLEKERAAESQKRADVLVAEGKRQAAIAEAQATVESAKLIVEAMKGQVDTKAVLKYLIEQRRVDANYELGKSSNSKIIFMDPKGFDEATAELISDGQDRPTEH